MNKVIWPYIASIIFLAGCVSPPEDSPNLSAPSPEKTSTVFSPQPVEETDPPKSTSVPEPAQLLPTPPTEYRFTILSQVLVAKEEGETWSGVICGRMLAYAAGLAVNENDVTLFSPDVYIEAYDGDQLVDRFSLHHGTGLLVLPGERAIFTSDRPKCKNFSPVTRKGYGLSDVRYEIALYADPIPDYYSLMPYRDMEIVSVSEQRREDGTVLEITVANTGSEPAYPFLNFIFYDEAGIPVEANYILATIFDESGDTLSPGNQATVTLFMDPPGVDYEFFLLGASPKDGE